MTCKQPLQKRNQLLNAYNYTRVAEVLSPMLSEELAVTIEQS